MNFKNIIPTLDLSKFEDSQYTIRKDDKNVFSDKMRKAKPYHYIFIASVIAGAIFIISRKADDKLAVSGL